MQPHERRWEEGGGYRSGQMEPWRTSEGERSWRGTQNGDRAGRSRGQYRGEGWDDEDFGRGGYPERGWYGGSFRGREEEDFGDRGESRPYRSSSPSFGREDERERFSSGRESYRREDFGREGREGYGRENYGQGYGREGFGQGYGREGYGTARGSFGREGYGQGREAYGRFGYGGPSFSRESERFREGDRSFGQGYGGQGSYGGSYRQESPGRIGSQEWNRSGSEWAGGGWGSGMGREGGMSRGYGTYSGRAPKNYKRSDERIREDVCDVLTESDLDCEEVEVMVKDGEVTLSGTVQSREERREMERTAERVTGVKDVTNQLRVKRESGKGSDENRKQTQSATPQGQGYSDSRRGTMTSTRPE